VNDNIHSVLDRFRATATKFIQTVNSAAEIPRGAFLGRLGQSLAELYSSALHLPVGELDTSSTDEPQLDREKWAKLTDSLRQKLGPLDAYWEIFDSTENGSSVQGSLASDISEIYSDLTHDLDLVDVRGISQADLLWDLRFSFRSHWGKHLLGTLRAIHDRHVE
jgi:Domain of unknown function (DUF5063)